MRLLFSLSQMRKQTHTAFLCIVRTLLLVEQREIVLLEIHANVETTELAPSTLILHSQNVLALELLDMLEVIATYPFALQ